MGTERGVPANTEVRAAIQPNLSDVDKRVVAYLDDRDRTRPGSDGHPAGGGTLLVYGSMARMVQDLLFGARTRWPQPPACTTKSRAS